VNNCVTCMRSSYPLAKPASRQEFPKKPQLLPTTTLQVNTDPR
jgi:hypothetical protein